MRMREYLALAVALFNAPATYLLISFLLSHRGSLSGGSPSASVEAVMWTAGVGALFVPHAFPKLLRSSSDSVRLILALTVSVAPSVFGLFVNPYMQF